MQIETISISTLNPYARNSRTHSPEQIDQIAASIREFGFTNPVLIDEHNGIIAGHGRVRAAQELDMEVIPCIRLLHLTEMQRRAYIIADNKLAINADWDMDILLEELNTIDLDIGLTGFCEDEINSLYSCEGTKNKEEIKQSEQYASQNKQELQEEDYKKEMENKKQRGQINIVPKYAEHHQAFVILCDNRIDEAWFRQKLALEEPLASYKDSKIRQANITTIHVLRNAFQA